MGHTFQLVKWCYEGESSTLATQELNAMRSKFMFFYFISYDLIFLFFLIFC